MPRNIEKELEESNLTAELDKISIRQDKHNCARQIEFYMGFDMTEQF